MLKRGGTKFMSISLLYPRKSIQELQRSRATHPNLGYQKYNPNNNLEWKTSTAHHAFVSVPASPAWKPQYMCLRWTLTVLLKMIPYDRLHSRCDQAHLRSTTLLLLSSALIRDLLFELQVVGNTRKKKQFEGEESTYSSHVGLVS